MTMNIPDAGRPGSAPRAWVIRSAAVLAVVTVLSGCGKPDSGPAWSAGSPGSSPDSGPATVSATTTPPARPASASPGTPPPATVHYAFPVRGRASYAHEHHDYPATDIMAPCGAVSVAAVDGIVLEVTKVDTYEPRKNDGATRGGLSVSILGRDGVRYYSSHYSAIERGIAPGVSVSAGQPIARVGQTGDASACHVHFGISPACAKYGDWWTRRGAVWPWQYLDAWRSGRQTDPRKEVTAWQARHGCPTKALVDP